MTNTSIIAPPPPPLPLFSSGLGAQRGGDDTRSRRCHESQRHPASIRPHLADDADADDDNDGDL